MTGSDVRHVTGSEPVRKYVMRMYNRKLRNIRPSWAFWSEVTVTWPQEALSGSGHDRKWVLRMPTPKGTPKGSNDLRQPCYYCTTTKKKARGKSRACAEPTSGQDHFRTGPLAVTWLCHFRSKVTTMVDITQLPVVHAQNILPDIRVIPPTTKWYLA
jgi:hypothetical protein